MLNAYTVSTGALMITSCLERKGGLMCFSRKFLTHMRTKPNCYGSVIERHP